MKISNGFSATFLNFAKIRRKIFPAKHGLRFFKFFPLFIAKMISENVKFRGTDVCGQN